MLKSLRSLFAATPPPQGNTPSTPPTRDASELLQPAAAALQAGDTAQAQQLLESVLESHHDLAEAHLMLGQVHHAARRLEDASDCYVLAACFRTDWWHPHFHLGLLELDQARFDRAVQALTKALELGAVDARVHNALGAAYLNCDRIDAAVDHFREAIAIQPDLAEAHSNLGYVLFRDLELFDEGARHIETALRLAPQHQAALCNWTMVLHQRGRTEESLALSERLLASDPNLNEARLNRALMLLTRQDFGRGWPDYEARRRSPRVNFTADLPWPEWDGAPLEGKTVFLYGEQGIGDEIMFSSCVPEVVAKAACCFVECSPKLEPLFRRSFPRAHIVRKHDWRNDRVVAQQRPDYKIAMGSLPRFLRNSIEDFPAHRGYLQADARRVGEWRRRLAELPGVRKVGISWRGGLASTRQSLRSIPLAQWSDLLRVPGVDFVSLQYSDCTAEIEQVSHAAHVQVHHWQDAIDDYDETAALVAALDLVISVQTAVVHLAGALGQRTWALIPAPPEWRYGCEGETIAWYPSVRLIRQSKTGDWQSVLSRVESELAS